MNLLNDHQTNNPNSATPFFPNPVSPLPLTPTSTPTLNKAEGPTKINVMSDVDRFAGLEANTADLRQRLRWHLAAWWVIFILLLASWFALATLILSQTSSVRGESQKDTTHLTDKLNEATQLTQSRIDTRASSLDMRVDQLLRDNALLRSELSTLAAKYAAQEGMCRSDCAADK